MPIPAPRKNENKKNFIARCMGDEVMKKEFSDIKQRYAVCLTQWKNKRKKKLER